MGKVLIGLCFLLGLNGCSFKDDPEPMVSFELDEYHSHLFWPFHNSNYPLSVNDNVYSKWQDQESNKQRNSSKELTTWRFANDHLFDNDLPTHHIGADWFAQDWNYFEGGNSDCGMSFFAPMPGQVLRVDRACVNLSGDCENPACNRDSPFIYGNQIYILQEMNGVNFIFRAAHFNSINEEISLNDLIYVGQLLGQIGNEGNSEASHVHVSLWKNVPQEVVDQIATGTIDLPADPSLFGDTYATDFCFDAEI